MVPRGDQEMEMGFKFRKVQVFPRGLLGAARGWVAAEPRAWKLTLGSHCLDVWTREALHGRELFG